MRIFLQRQGRDRQGMTVVVVLALISITLALSYAVMRSQVMAVQIQANSRRRASAREAALAGLSVGLRKMHETAWTGVETSFSGNLSPTESYQVSYVAGDASLEPSDPDYAEYPYRVTVISTGSAMIGGQTSATTHQVQAVVRLTPRQLSAAPSDLAQIVQYTLYQLTDDNFFVELPTRIEGPIRLQGTLWLGDAYDWSSSILGRFLSDLNQMRLANLGDYRPFSGPIHLPFVETGSTTRSLLTGNLGLTISNIGQTSPSSQWVHPGSIGTYRIYPGGPLYSVATAAATLENTTLAPDPATNPLGVFYRSGDVTIRDNVTLRGTLIVSGSVIVRGTNVQVQTFQLPALDGSTRPVLLPSIVASSSLRVQSTGSGNIAGLIALWDDLIIDPRSQSLVLAISGRVVAEEVNLGLRTQWDFSSSLWGLLYGLFSGQLDNVSPMPYLPVWLILTGADPVPRVTIAPETLPVTYHWLRSSLPVYVPGAADTGLRWDLVRWQDSP